jgi:hypothetical protein
MQVLQVVAIKLCWRLQARHAESNACPTTFACSLSQWGLYFDTMCGSRVGAPSIDRISVWLCLNAFYTSIIIIDR